MGDKPTRSIRKVAVWQERVTKLRDRSQTPEGQVETYSGLRKMLDTEDQKKKKEEKINDVSSSRNK